MNNTPKKINEHILQESLKVNEDEDMDITVDYSIENFLKNRRSKTTLNYAKVLGLEEQRRGVEKVTSFILQICVKGKKYKISKR